MNSGDIIQVRDLRKIYLVGKVQVPALRGVDLDVKPGEFLSIVGPSGSGKSTLFHIIGGLTPPTSGEVRVAGQDLAAMTDAGRTRMRKRTVGFVFQKFNLLPNLTRATTSPWRATSRATTPSPRRASRRFCACSESTAGWTTSPSALSGGERSASPSLAPW